MVGKGRLITRVYALHLTLLLLAIGCSAWFTAAFLSAYYTKQNHDALAVAGRWAMSQLEAPLVEGDIEAVAGRSVELSELAGLRITIARRDGTVIADTDADPAKMDNHIFRPEFEQAFQGGMGFAERYSDTLRHRRYYAAVPLIRDGQVVAVVRVSVPMGTGVTLADTYRSIVLVCLVVAAVAGLGTLALFRRISSPLDVVKRGLARMVQGDAANRLTIPEEQEFAEIVAAVNAIAAQLEDRAARAVSQRNELEAILRSMVEGIVAVDDRAEVLNINRAAAVFFDVDPEKIVGMSLEEAIRNPDLHEFVRRTLRGQAVVDGEIVVYQEGQRYLHAHGTVLQDMDGRTTGGVVVLNDVTRVRRLEEARSRFVANVSHELRTPITSIKGYVETLLDGAVDDPPALERFLAIIDRQAQRLNSLIEDLLTLSRIEQEEGKANLEFEFTSAQDVADAAVSICRPGAEEKGIDLSLHAEGEVTTKLNAPLLQQAVINLIDNAVKYSDAGTTVKVEVFRALDAIVIAVSDTGCGISDEHLPRLFERFYRVDAARSRKLGGTGLGLSIVKHITLVHGGKNSVRSQPGQGSRFTIELPLVQAVTRNVESAV